MPVTYNQRDKAVSIHDVIDSESVGTVQRMLEVGEITDISLVNVDLKLIPVLNLTKLTRLSISDTPCFDLGFLNRINRLESLRLGFLTSAYAKKIRVGTIPPMDTLKVLTVAGITGLKDLPQLPALYEINLMGIKNEQLDFLDSYPSIRDVFISGGHWEGYAKLLYCKNLERLRIIQSREINFAGITADGGINHSLKILELSHCPSLISFDFLHRFAAMKYMDITSCNKLSSFEGIENCRNLEVVNISECKVRDKTLKWLLGVKKVLLGGSYRKEEVRQFEKEFTGEMYSIGKFDKGRFDYLDHYTRHYSKSLDTHSSSGGQ